MPFRINARMKNYLAIQNPNYNLDPISLRCAFALRSQGINDKYTPK